MRTDRPTCVAIAAKMWLVRPLGFKLDDYYLRRAGLEVPVIDLSPHIPWEPQAEAIGATWSFGYYRYPIPRRPSLRGWTRAGWDIARTSLDLWRDIRRHRATHVFAPEFNAVLRSLPALWLARCALGVRVVVRLGNAPEPGTFYRWLWRVLTTGVDQFVSNSRFIERELLAHGIDRRKSRVVFNTVPHRAEPWVSRPRVAGRVVFVGQIIPLKGLDLLLDAIATLAAEGIDSRKYFSPPVHRQQRIAHRRSPPAAAGSAGGVSAMLVVASSCSRVPPNISQSFWLASSQRPSRPRTPMPLAESKSAAGASARPCSRAALTFSSPSARRYSFGNTLTKAARD